MLNGSLQFIEAAQELKRLFPVPACQQQAHVQLVCVNVL